MALRHISSKCTSISTRSAQPTRFLLPILQSNASFSTTPHSPAAIAASKPPVKKPPSDGIIGRVAAGAAKGIKEVMPVSTETYVAYRTTKELYNECCNQATYVEGMELSETARFWYTECKRPLTFQSWAQVTMLHMWIMIVRMRAFQNAQIWQQHFLDHFFYDSEAKMGEIYKVTNNGQRKKYLKDLYIQYRGFIAAFDEGLCKSDAVFATSLWRNLFNAESDVDFEALAVITAYVRRCISTLDKVDDEAVMSGRIAFGSPVEEREIVMQKSQWTPPPPPAAAPISPSKVGAASEDASGNA